MKKIKSLIEKYKKLDKVDKTRYLIFIISVFVLLSFLGFELFLFADNKIKHPSDFGHIAKNIDFDEDVNVIIQNYIEAKKQASGITDRDELLKEIYYEITLYMNYSSDEKYDENHFARDIKWYEKVAYDGLKNKEGSCYYYAAVFALFARNLGYDDVYIINGTVIFKSKGETNPHHYVEIDGLLYDPTFDATPETVYFNELSYFGVDALVYDKKGGIINESSRDRVE